MNKIRQRFRIHDKQDRYYVTTRFSGDDISENGCKKDFIYSDWIDGRGLE